MPMDGLGVGAGAHARLAMTTKQRVAIRADETEPLSTDFNLLP
jgi:hypothetical protein